MKCFIKASLSACLFLCVQVTIGQNFIADNYHKSAYEALWNLENPKPLSESNTDPLSIYINSLHNALHIILNEGESELEAYEKHFDELEELLDNGKNDAETLFVKSEILLHYAFVQLKFGNEISAAWMIRKSYKLVKQGITQHPTFKPLLKTSGVHHIMMGSIPKKYEWLMSLFGLNGNIKEGLEQLNQLMVDDPFFKHESIAITKLIGVYLFIENKSVLKWELPKNDLSHLINALIHSKDGNNEIALSELNKIRSHQNQYPVISYLTAEALLRASQYPAAIRAYQKFLKFSRGASNIKDAYFKLGVIHYLTNSPDSVKFYFDKAQQNGERKSEADKHAAKVLSNDRLPHPLIVKLRISTDGGYFKKASQLIKSADNLEFEHFNDKLEFEYRRARLYHKQDSIEQAIDSYRTVIQRSPAKGYYYAPNACLQLGLIYNELDDHVMAREYLTRVSTYSKHEYKSSLDQKAKTILASLPEPPSGDPLN
ncbi:MAG: tetratricopeptide repeat protein [Bacteroidota bacterium]